MLNTATLQIIRRKVDKATKRADEVQPEYCTACDMTSNDKQRCEDCPRSASSGATTQAVRMLTRDELNDVALSEQVGWGPGEYVEAIQRKFCEVNKLRIPADGVIGAKSPLICPRCKVDRLKDDCPGPRDSCPIKFDAQSGGAA